MRTLVLVPVVVVRLGDSTGQYWLYKLLCCRAVIRCQSGSAGYKANVMLTAIPIPIHTQNLMSGAVVLLLLLFHRPWLFSQQVFCFVAP